jgi:hypothetical protein
MLRRPVKVGRCARRFKQLRGTCTRWRGEASFGRTADRRVIESHDLRLGAELHPGAKLEEMMSAAPKVCRWRVLFPTVC